MYKAEPQFTIQSRITQQLLKIYSGETCVLKTRYHLRLGLYFYFHENCESRVNFYVHIPQGVREAPHYCYY